jgi:hypothetical protein
MPETSNEKFLGNCEYCNKHKMISHECDPYVYELYDEEEWVNICEDCYQNRCDEI